MAIIIFTKCTKHQKGFKLLKIHYLVKTNLVRKEQIYYIFSLYGLFAL